MRLVQILASIGIYILASTAIGFGLQALTVDLFTNQVNADREQSYSAASQLLTLSCAVIIYFNLPYRGNLFVRLVLAVRRAPNPLGKAVPICVLSACILLPYAAAASLIAALAKSILTSTAPGTYSNPTWRQSVLMLTLLVCGALTVLLIVSLVRYVRQTDAYRIIGSRARSTPHSPQAEGASRSFPTSPGSVGVVVGLGTFAGLASSIYTGVAWLQILLAAVAAFVAGSFATIQYKMAVRDAIKRLKAQRGEDP